MKRRIALYCGMAVILLVGTMFFRNGWLVVGYMLAFMCLAVDVATMVRNHLVLRLTRAEHVAGVMRVVDAALIGRRVPNCHIVEVGGKYYMYYQPQYREGQLAEIGFFTKAYPEEAEDGTVMAHDH